MHRILIKNILIKTEDISRMSHRRTPYTIYCW